MKIIIGTIVFILVTGNLYSFSLSNQNGKNARKELQSYFNYPEGSGIFSSNYDSARIMLLYIIKKAEKENYWDICLKALCELASISDQNFRYPVQKEAVEKGQLILRLKSAVLDSLDPTYTIRASMIIMIGSYYNKNGEFNKAVVVLQALVQELKKTKKAEKKDIFNVYAYLADLYMKQGLYEKVYEYYLLAGQTIPDDKKEHTYYTYIHDLYLGSYFYRMKNYILAKSYYIKALRTIKNKQVADNWHFLVSNYNILALIYQSLNQRDSALICLRRSLALKGSNDSEIMETYEYYGDCLLNFNDCTGALYYFNKINKYLNESSNYAPYKKAGILLKIGNSYQNQGNYQKAIMNYQRALTVLYNDSAYLRSYEINPLHGIIQPDKTIIRLLILKSNALFEMANRSHDKMKLLLQALSTYQLATGVIDDFRQKISTDDFKEFFVTDIRKMYQNAINACYSIYKISRSDSIIESAFYFMEKSKNQVLLDAIRANTAMKFSHIPNSLIVTEYKYKNQIVALENKLYGLKFNGADPQLIRNCQYEYAKTQNSYGEFLHHLENSYPGYYNFKYGNKVPTIKEIQKLIKKQVLIEYMVGDNFIGVIAFNNENSFFNLIPIDTTFTHNLTGFLNDLGNTHTDENSFSPEVFKTFVNRAGSLYSVLLLPALNEFKNTGRLIIIPDDRLCFLPFEVLINRMPENFNRVDYRHLNYLIRQYIIHYEFSSELFFEHSQLSSRIASRNSYLGFAPTYNQKAGLKKVNVLGRGNSGFLTPLTYNRAEIEEAAAIFNGKAIVGKNATAKSFRDNSLSSKIIHIAAHTIINDSIPELSGIFFSDESDNGINPYNDVIYVNEIYNLNVNARLAILSACGTGKGKLLKGEGLISIGRAFQYAGCPGMITSLWKISDRSASDIMKLFCQNLKKGQRIEVALRQAKLDYLDHTGFIGHTHPFYWSAFVLIGNDESLFHRNFRVFIISGFLMIAIIFWIIFRRKS